MHFFLGYGPSVLLFCCIVIVRVLSLCLYLSVCQSSYGHVNYHQELCLSVCLYLCVCLCLSGSPKAMITRSSVCLSVCLYLCVSVSVRESYGHDHQELCLCVCLSVSLCVSVSVQESYGRVTYHQELWLFPSLLLFHSDLARLLLSSRHRQIPAARSSALSLNRPGALLPYESGATGMSFVSPSVCHKTE